MASYFRQVPNFEYISRNNGEKYISEYIPVKNLFKRGKLREDIFGNLSFFEKYSIIGDERPDNVAFKFYEDETLDWVILLSNNILNIQTEWPLSQQTFDKVMLEKYESYDNLYSGIHHYETEEIKNSLGITIVKSGTIINDTWRTNGNFVEIINSKIENIFSGDGIEATTVITVELQNGIAKLEVGDQIAINNVSEPQYNGQVIVSEIIEKENETVKKFTYNLSFVPNEVSPILSEPRKEEVLWSIPEDILEEDRDIIKPNSYYYEFWDAGLGSQVQIPSTSFVKPVTNYEYELRIENEKRNIFILKPQYLSVVFNDLEELMAYKKGSQQFVSENLKRGDNIRLYT